MPNSGLIERSVSIKSKVLDAIIPIFIIIFPDETNNYVEFHWWTSKELDIKNVKETLYCPNPPIRKNKISL